MTERTVTAEEMENTLNEIVDEGWTNAAKGKLDAIRATLKEHAALEQENDKLRQHLDIDTKAYLSLIDQFCALEKENAELKARLGDISTTSFYALKDAYTALKEWKAGVVERAIRALMPKKIDPDEAEHIIRDIAAEGEKK